MYLTYATHDYLTHLWLRSLSCLYDCGTHTHTHTYSRYITLVQGTPHLFWVLCAAQRVLYWIGPIRGSPFPLELSLPFPCLCACVCGGGNVQPMSQSLMCMRWLSAIWMPYALATMPHCMEEQKQWSVGCNLRDLTQLYMPP